MSVAPVLPTKLQIQTKSDCAQPALPVVVVDAMKTSDLQLTNVVIRYRQIGDCILFVLTIAFAAYAAYCLYNADHSLERVAQASEQYATLLRKTFNSIDEKNQMTMSQLEKAKVFGDYYEGWP